MTVVSKRIRRDADSSRDNILSAAEGLIREHGPEGFKLTEVARRAGTTHSNVIAHFGSVLDLQRQTASRIAARLVAEIAGELIASDISAEPIRQAIKILFVAVAREDTRRLFAWIMLHDQTGDLPGLDAGLDTVRSLVLSRLNARGKQAALDPLAVGRIMRLVIGAALGTSVAGRYLDGLGPSDPAELADVMAALLYDSFN